MPKLRRPPSQVDDEVDPAWRVGLSILVCGLRVGIRASDEEALRRVLHYMPAGWKRTSDPRVDRLYSLRICGGRDYERVYIDGQRVRGPDDNEGTLKVLEADLTAFLIARARSKVYVHAGVVACNGKAVIIPGKSDTGKTTLVTALVRAGATYYSDELAIIDGRGRVHPFARRLELWHAGSFQRCSAEDLGGRTGTKPVPVSMVILTEHKSGVVWRPTPLPPGQGVIRILEHTVSDSRRRPGFVLSSLAEITSVAQVLNGARGDASETATMVLKKLK